ncbi:unnamed protein product [Cyclocybe aegerita]|uniref:F-box domain-containing protein n=1 Tax=Cyclocybe aegerita TaxID=1973307 RepID=A0A8S0W195_CYCAE|nr:unnamed protein product [Cyclocybe aegerita]
MGHFSCIICGQDREFSAKQLNITCTSWRTTTAPCPNCVRTKTLDEHIEQTRAYLRHLEAHRATLRPGANAFHDPFITHFPTEIASKILSFCVDNEREYKRRIPLALSAVSRRWQAIAHSTPSLWTNIRLRLFGKYENRVSYNEMLLHWLSRSSKQPLSIYLDMEYCRRDEVSKVQFCRSVIELLNMHCHRWGRLSVDMPLHLISLLRGDFHSDPPLSHLSIGGEEYDEDEDEDQDNSQTWKFDLGTSLPSPHTVTIHQCGFDKVRINWCNVTNVSIWFPRLRDLLTLLAAAPQLHECRVVRPDGFAEATNTNPTNPIIHRNLLKLDLTICGSRIVLCPFLLPIRSLASDSHSDHRADLFDILRAVPALERLDIAGAFIFNNFFELLGTDDEEHRFLPSLTEFGQLCPLWTEEFSWPDISKAVEARAHPHRGKCGLPVLKRFYWGVTLEDENSDIYYIDEESLQIFERLLSNGVDIKLSNNWRKRGRSDDMIVYSRAYHEENKHRSTIDD